MGLEDGMIAQNIGNLHESLTQTLKEIPALDFDASLAWDGGMCHVRACHTEFEFLISSVYTRLRLGIT